MPDLLVGSGLRRNEPMDEHTHPEEDYRLVKLKNI
jgi:hypothetical protein